ncbi:Viral (Superfamily 1) RNA helicase [Pseudomonas fluorescens]|uniref:Helicase n=1 Tax=Pseudomonas azotoformans TaxID=47878 RepID=A0A4V1K0L4_PSEAZ|nr:MULTISPECIES: hypothetical protein [Pseudomonas]KRP92933.1 hypothetical protein TX25_15210 [Pseudomonas lactis]KWV77548.1 Viral (Superfamily 1) RNA helicase [Pseudomonas fluorescens]MBJ2304622.1 hypothetical protein [Pseudomonas sp. MF2846]MBK3490012.1 hypothetical protein [Pseudomonas sp. MF2857]MCR8661027.1 hypothetical protein [Pseudomonas carnis]
MHSEHFDLSSPVFLPITEHTCAGLLGGEGFDALVALSEPELAAVLVIQNLAQVPESELSANGAEKVLAKLVDWAVDASHSASVSLLSEAQRLFDQRKLYFGLNVVKSLKLRFLLEEEVQARDYLLPSGKWDVEYKVRHLKANDPFSQQVITPRHRERWLSAEQDKLLRTFRANLNEDLHVQGYAGIGKSHLLVALLEHLRPEKTLLLARTPAKLETLRARMVGARERKVGHTFQDFAHALLHGPRPKPLNTPVRVPTKQALAQELNIFGFRRLEGQAVVEVCLKVLEAYCRSWEYSLSAQHLPHFKQPLAGVDARALLEYASRLWGYLEANPAWGRHTGFEALLMIKRASLAGCVVPERYTHVLIDESQDIPAPLLQIIERGRQVLITLGDEYQQASGGVVKRAREVRHTDVCYSVRSGRNVERLVNPLISLHSEKSKSLFEGARDADVGIEFYPQGFVPPQGCVVLTASHWDTMQWAIQLSHARCAFGLASKEAQQSLKHFMDTVIALFKPDFYSNEFNDLGPHAFFSDMADWQQVREACQFDEAFLWVEAELEKGFNVADVTRLNRLIGHPDERVLLMLAQDAGGMEFDRVLLTPELLTNVKFQDAYAFDQRLCAVYIAISRARVQLYLPYDVVEWLDYHKYQKTRESHGY